MLGFIFITVIFVCLWRCTSPRFPKPPPLWQELWHEWNGKAQAARARHIAEMEWLAQETAKYNNEHQS